MANDKTSIWKRKVYKIPVPLLALLVVAGLVAAGVLLGPASSPAPTTVQRITVSISGVPDDTLWGNQYLPQEMNVSVATNTYTASHDTIPFIVLGTTGPVKACADLVTDGFLLRVSKDFGSTWVDISGTCASAAAVSKGDTVWGSGYVYFLPSSGNAMKTIAAGATAGINSWLFETTLAVGVGVDVFGTTYNFHAQTITP